MRTPDDLAGPGLRHETGSRVHEALVALLRELKSLDYRFITVTPTTHGRVIGRPGKALAADLRDVFGWSLPFEAALLPPSLLNLLEQADGVARRDGLLSSTFRVSALGDDLFLHSAFPPAEKDSVFFGPDTYRFASFLQDELRGVRGGVLVDVGAGSGAGAIVAHRMTQPDKLILTDINPRALAMARANAAAAGVDGAFLEAAGFSRVKEQANVIIANPPFIADDGGRTYRDGGDMHGAKLSLDWVLEGAERLAPEGVLLMYTGSAIVDGGDAFRETLEKRVDPVRFALSYRELDPDIFGEQLEAASYRDVERIAAVGLVVRRLRASPARPNSAPAGPGVKPSRGA